MRAFIIIAGLAALASCATQCPGADLAPGPTTAQFRCDAGDSFTVTFMHNPNQARIEAPGFDTVTLPEAPAGSGYRYQGGGVELRGRGSEARLTRPGGGEHLCREAN